MPRTPRWSFAAVALSALSATSAVSAADATRPATAASTHQPFGATADGKPVEIYTLTNPSGASVSVLTYGAILNRVQLPDRAGKVGDVLLGYDSVAQYEKDSGPFFGALVGRVANRIAKATFTVDGATYHTPVNNGPNTLHGGPAGFDKRVWTAQDVTGDDGQAVKLSLVDPDGTAGFPGTVHASVTYTLTDAGVLRLTYEATTDKATPINLTSHGYWNLRDGGKSDVKGELMQWQADKYLPVDAVQIPTGQLAPVAGTPFDFRTTKPIGRRPDRDRRQAGRVRPLHGDRRQARHPPPGRDGHRPGQRPRPGHVHDRTRRPVLHRQFPRRLHHRPRRHRLRPVPRVRPGGPGVPRRGQPPELPEQHPPARPDVPPDDGVPVRHERAPAEVTVIAATADPWKRLTSFGCKPDEENSRRRREGPRGQAGRVSSRPVHRLAKMVRLTSCLGTVWRLATPVLRYAEGPGGPQSDAGVRSTSDPAWLVLGQIPVRASVASAFVVAPFRRERGPARPCRCGWVYTRGLRCGVKRPPRRHRSPPDRRGRTRPPAARTTAAWRRRHTPSSKPSPRRRGSRRPKRSTAARTVSGEPTISRRPTGNACGLPRVARNRSAVAGDGIGISRPRVRWSRNMRCDPARY